MDETYTSISLPSRLGTEKQAMDFAETFLNQLNRPVPPELVEDIKTLVSEACLNAIEHGNACDESLHYSFQIRLEKEDNIVFTVSDSGGTSNWPTNVATKAIHPVLAEHESTRGWGLKIIDALAEDWTIHHDENGTSMTVWLGLKSSTCSEGGVKR